MVCLAPRAREESMRPRRLADASMRPLSFTVRSRVQPLLRFRAPVLDVAREPRNSINPIHGESLLRWIGERWKGDSPMSAPAPEDWGWCADVSWAGKRYMLGAACSDARTGQREWFLGVVKYRTIGEWLLGRNKMAADDACLGEIIRLLKGEPGFQELTLL